MSFNNLSKKEIADFAAANGRMALKFIPALPNDDTKSFVGGYPRLPNNMDWPKDDRTELMFLAQIDLSDLPWRPEGWPSGGTLYLFHNTRLEGAEHRSIAISRTEDGAEYPSKFVYFASEGQTLVTAKPKNPHTQKTFFQYEGDGSYHYGRSIGPRLERDCLPFAALRFAPHVQYYSEAWFNAQQKASGIELMEAFEQYGDASSHLRKVLAEQQTSAENQMIADLGASWYGRESEEEIIRRIYGGVPHIDVGGLLQKLPVERAFQHIRQHTYLDQRYVSWPETGGMVMHHAMSVANSVDRGRGKDEPLTQLAQEHVAGAREWAEWGYQRARQLLPQDERDVYLAWARTVFRETLKIYERSWRLRPIRKYVMPPFGKSKGISANAGQALRIARSLVSLSDAREFGLRILFPEQISAMPDHARIGYLNGVLRGQLFGWGSEVQSEVKDNDEHLCLAAIYGNRDISFEADFKIWLPRPLQPDAWQPVIVVNAIS